MMLKGKKSIYILLPLNLLVWGFIGWKIISALGGDEVPDPADTALHQTALVAEDTASTALRLNYDDPFLKQEGRPKSQARLPLPGTPPAQASAPAPKAVPEQKPEREIRYLGAIQNKTNGKVTALISINGSSHTIKKGDAIEGLLFKDITAEYLEIREGKKTYRISK